MSHERKLAGKVCLVIRIFTAMEQGIPLIRWRVWNSIFIMQGVNMLATMAGLRQTSVSLSWCLDKEIVEAWRTWSQNWSSSTRQGGSWILANNRSLKCLRCLLIHAGNSGTRTALAFGECVPSFVFESSHLAYIYICYHGLFLSIPSQARFNLSCCHGRCRHSHRHRRYPENQLIHLPVLHLDPLNPSPYHGPGIAPLAAARSYSNPPKNPSTQLISPHCRPYFHSSPPYCHHSRSY